MGAYREKKLEYWKGSTGPLKLYMNFILPVYVLIAVISFTWNITVVGYQEPVFFMLDFLVCALSITALFSVYAVDRYTVIGNIPFLLAVMGAKVYRTLFITGVVGGAAAEGAGEAVGAMGGAAGGMAMDAGMGMSGMAMGGGSMGGMGMMDGMGAGAAMVNENLSLFGKLISKAATSIFKQTGDLTNFIATLECEIFACVCLFFIVYFLVNIPFFFSSLQKLREKAEGV